MSFRLCFIGGAVVGFLTTVAAPASAQFVIGNGGMSVNGVDLSAYGGVSSVEIMDSGYASPGFSAGVIGPYGGSYIGSGWGGGFYPGYPTAYYGSSFGGFGYGYGGGGGFWGGNFVAAPLVIPAETMYGPGPVRRMMGLDPPLGTPIIQQTTVVNNPAPRPNGFGVLANPQPHNNIPGRPNVIAANPQTQQRARKIVDAGDVAFQQQKFAEAYANYKDAARAAPDLADAYFRQAAAAIALQRYEEAAAAIKFGLRLSSGWVDSKFRFSALYGAAVLARQQHLAALAQAANDRPTSDVQFVYGVALFFDHHPVWARAPLERARALAIGETWHIELFLKAIERMPLDDAPQPAMPNQRPAPRPVDDGVRDI